MKKLLLAAFISSAVLLSACAPPEPTVFGVKESVWKTLTAPERQQVINGYNQTQKINAKNAPLESAISATSDAVQAKQQQDNWKDQQKEMRNDMPSIHMPPMAPPPSMPNMQ